MDQKLPFPSLVWKPGHIETDLLSVSNKRAARLLGTINLLVTSEYSNTMVV